MSLPTYWISQNRKDLAERAIVARREREAAQVRKCKEAESYHKELALKSTRYKNLENAPTLKTPRVHEESSVREDREAARKNKIEMRRQKLARILSVENEQYMKELQEIKERDREKDPWNNAKLREQIQELQRKRKEIEQNMQKRYTRNMFTSGDFSSKKKEKEEEYLQKEVVEAWNQRKEELEKLNLEKQQKEQEKLEILELEQKRAAQEAWEAEKQQIQEKEKWYSSVQNKMSEISIAENETKTLKVEKNILIEHLENLHSLLRKRNAIRDLHKKAFQKIQLMYQAKEKLRRMLNEVKHGLDFDYKLLLTLSDLNNCTSEDTALALLDLSCVDETREKIEMQIALEKERELEIQQLYQEEAAGIWENKKEQWILESIARDEIMQELLKTLVNQINKKIEISTEEGKKLINLKENYLGDIETINQSAKETSKSLMGKYDYYASRANRLSEELSSRCSSRASERPSSSQSKNFLTFS